MFLAFGLFFLAGGGEWVEKCVFNRTCPTTPEHLDVTAIFSTVIDEAPENMLQKNIAISRDKSI